MPYIPAYDCYISTITLKYHSSSNNESSNVYLRDSNFNILASTTIFFGNISNYSPQYPTINFNHYKLNGGQTYYIHITSNIVVNSNQSLEICNDPDFTDSRVVGSQSRINGGAWCGDYPLSILFNVMPYSGSYTVQLSTTQVGVGGNLQVGIADTNSNVVGSSASYFYQYANSPTDNSQPYQQVFDKSIIVGASNYTNIMVYCTRNNSTTTAITSQLSLTPALGSYTTTVSSTQM